MNITLFFLSWKSRVLFHKETLMLCLNEFLCCAPTDAPPSAHYPHHRVRCKPEWLRLMSSWKNYFSVVSLRWQTPQPPTPVTPMNTVSGLSFEPGAPRSDMQQRNWSENQGSEPSNRLVKEPATTASSMGYKQRWVDLKHSTEEGAAVVSVSDISERYNLLVQSGVAAARFLWIFVTSWMSVFIKHFLLLFLAYIPRQKAKRWKASPPLSPPPPTEHLSRRLQHRLTPPDGEPAGSTAVIPTEMAEIATLEWSPTLVFCTFSLFCTLVVVVECVTMKQIDCRTATPPLRFSPLLALWLAWT